MKLQRFFLRILDAKGLQLLKNIINLSYHHKSGSWAPATESLAEPSGLLSRRSLRRLDSGVEGRKFKFHHLQDTLPPHPSSSIPYPDLMRRGVAAPARPPGPVPPAPSKQREPLMGLIGISGTGEEALTECVTDGAGKCWRPLPLEINDY